MYSLLHSFKMFKEIQIYLKMLQTLMTNPFFLKQEFCLLIKKRSGENLGNNFKPIYFNFLPGGRFLLN